MTLAVDFDQVVHEYSKGWHDGTIYDPPMPGAVEGLRTLMAHEPVFIFTARRTDQTAEWLTGLGFTVRVDDGSTGNFWNERGVLLVTNRKLAARAYLDDRAVVFTTWGKALADLLPNSAQSTEDTSDTSTRVCDGTGHCLCDGTSHCLCPQCNRMPDYS